MHELLEGVANILSTKPITLRCTAIYRNHDILAAVSCDLCEEDWLAIFLNNVFANAARNVVEVHGIVEVIPDYGVLPKTREKALEALVSIGVVTGLGINSSYCGAGYITRLFVV